MRSLTLTLAALSLLLISGCESDNVSADALRRGEEAAKAAPQSAEELPSDMDPEAKAAAQRAIESSRAANQHMQTQGDAMKRAVQNGVTKN